MTSITTRVSKSVLVTFYLTHGSNYFFSYRLKITNMISFVEMGKNTENSIWCQNGSLQFGSRQSWKTTKWDETICLCWVSNMFGNAVDHLGRYLF